MTDPIENECTEHDVFLLLLFQGTFLKCPLDWRILNYYSLYFYFIIKLLFGIDNSRNSLNPNHRGSLLSSQSMRKRRPVGIWTPNYLAEFRVAECVFDWGPSNTTPTWRTLLLGFQFETRNSYFELFIIFMKMAHNKWTHPYKLWSWWVHLQKTLFTIWQ